MKLILHSRRLWSQNSRERRRSGGRKMCRPDQDRGVCQNDSQSDEKALCVNQILRIYVMRICHRRHRRRFVAPPSYMRPTLCRTRGAVGRAIPC